MWEIKALSTPLVYITKGRLLQSYSLLHKIARLYFELCTLTLIYYGQPCPVLNFVASDVFQDSPGYQFVSVQFYKNVFLVCDWSPVPWKLKEPSPAAIDVRFLLCRARWLTSWLPNFSVGPWCWEHTCQSGCSLRGQVEQLILCDTCCNNS